MSAYGGVIAANSKVTMEMAESVRPIFTEVIVAPDYDADALELLQTKKKNLRILKVSEPPKSKTQFRQIDGGLLVQSTDLIDAPGDDPNAWKLVSGEPAYEQTVKDLVFAWRAIRCVKSNAILIAHDQATVGIGMGQVNRVDSANLSVERANTLADGANRTKALSLHPTRSSHSRMVRKFSSMQALRLSFSRAVPFATRKCSKRLVRPASPCM